MKLIFTIALSFLFFGCDDFPRDPENSFSEAKKNHLKVGVAINPPYTEMADESYSGLEIELIRKFAEKENLQVDFINASESELMKKIEKYELHLIAGGFEQKTIWKKKVGLSVPYDKKHVLMVGKGENKLLQKLESFIFKTKRK